jgi:hypothetical protein
MNKPDLNYIAALEKAVQEKYGPEAIQNFRAEWGTANEADYLSQLKETSVSPKQPRSPRARPSRTCPECKTYSFSSRDDLYMNRFSCCVLCYEDFVRGMETKWKNGWRPSSEQRDAASRRRK